MKNELFTLESPEEQINTLLDEIIRNKKDISECSFSFEVEERQADGSVDQITTTYRRTIEHIPAWFPEN